MILIPAIDLYNGACVRLQQGQFTAVSEYATDPLQVANDFKAEGATELHIVDLNGAKIGSPQQLAIALKIKMASQLVIQLGGGLRSQTAIIAALNSGIDRVVIGSLAATDPDIIFALLNQYGINRFVVAFDVRIDGLPKIAINGWRDCSDLNLWDRLDLYQRYPGLRLLCTDINRDGMLSGPNLDLYRACIKRYPQLQFQASGGVATLKDLANLNKIGINSVIMGKALYENKFTLKDALSEVVPC